MSQRPTLLILDDEVDVARALRRSLRGEGYRILLAQDADEAFSHLERESVAAVLSDAWMPKLDGLPFLTKVRHLQPDAGRILVTAHPESIGGDGVLEAGLSAVIGKPWDVGELRNAVRRVCQAAE